MTLENAIVILPLLVLGEAAVVCLLAAAFLRDSKVVPTLALVGLAAAFGTLWMAAGQTPRYVSTLLVVDRYAIFDMGLIIVTAAAVALLALQYLSARESRTDEFYVLLLLATLGASVLVASCHFVSFFLGLELLSVSLYSMIAYEADHRRGLEAALKYLILAGVASAFLLFGMALVYADTGTMGLFSAREVGVSLLGWVGMGLIVVGFGFKLAVFPFHLWTPDIYQGAPAPVTAFTATVSKGAVFALLLRYSRELDFHARPALFVAFAAIAVASMFVGNLLGLMQSNIKRMLAYSSIAHLGYLLVAFLASGAMAAAAVSYYLTAYFIATLGAFGCVTVLSSREREMEEVRDYQGLAWRSPWMGITLTASLFSLAGLPLTAGFIGKFYLLAAGAGAGLWWLVVALVVSSGIGLVYYLRVIFTLYRPAEGSGVSRASYPMAGALVLCLLTVVLVWLGVFPGPLVNLIQGTVR